MSRQAREEPIEPSGTAFYGLPGEVVSSLAPHTEADPMALLVDLLACFGNAVGLGPHMWVDSSRHRPRLNVVVAGASSRSRKGTSRGVIRRVMEVADEEWSSTCEVSGLSTGEGLIEALRARKDPRLLVVEPEFSRVLRVAGRDGNTLSEVVRDLWDRDRAAVLTRGSPLSVRGKHVSLIVHITVEELTQRLNGLEAANGFGNRFIFIWVKRRRLLPMGNSVDPSLVEDLGRRIGAVLEKARTISEMRWRVEAEEPWIHFYRSLGDDVRGMVGALGARAEAQALRLAMIYALLDGESGIGPEHLEPALAIWDYSEQSLERIFGKASGDPVHDRVVAALSRAGSRGLTKTQIHGALGRHHRGEELDRVLSELVKEDLLTEHVEPTSGRPRTMFRWKDVPSPGANAKNANESSHGPKSRAFLSFLRLFRRRRQQE